MRELHCTIALGYPGEGGKDRGRKPDAEVRLCCEGS